VSKVTIRNWMKLARIDAIIDWRNGKRTPVLLPKQIDQLRCVQAEAHARLATRPTPEIPLLNLALTGEKEQDVRTLLEMDPAMSAYLLSRYLKTDWATAKKYRDRITASTSVEHVEASGCIR